MERTPDHVVLACHADQALALLDDGALRTKAAASTSRPPR
jgi:predicted NAD/FAD-binding protein